MLKYPFGKSNGCIIVVTFKLIVILQKMKKKNPV